MDNLWIWLVVSNPLKNMNVNWDDEIPNIWENKSHVPNHQPVRDVAGEQLAKHLLKHSSLKRGTRGPNAAFFLRCFFQVLRTSTAAKSGARERLPSRYPEVPHSKIYMFVLELGSGEETPTI